VTGWLLDTNVLSELRRPNPNPKVVGFVASRPLDLLFVSIVTFAEIRFGIERAVEPAQHAALNDWLRHKVRPLFDERGLVVGEGRKAGRTYSQPDLIIGATALHHGLTVVSRNTIDFHRARIPVLDPWRETGIG
jgi:toxin FitB